MIVYASVDMNDLGMSAQHSVAHGVYTCNYLAKPLSLIPSTSIGISNWHSTFHGAVGGVVNPV